MDDYGQRIEQLNQTPLKELQSEAFRIRKAHFGNELTFSIPGTVSYHDNTFPSQRETFAAVSVTGTHCDLRCGHCRGKLLESMIPAEDPETLLQVIDRLRATGALGVLVSGGADKNGEVPLDKFIAPIKAIKAKAPEFKVICHTGLIRKETAVELKKAGVDQILIDVIGDDDTIREVYHLEKRVEDYEETLWMLKELGHRLAPHIIIGHHYGEIRGEWRALEMVTRVGVETIVLVVLKSLHNPEASVQDSKAGRDVEDFCRCPYSQPCCPRSEWAASGRPIPRKRRWRKGASIPASIPSPTLFRVRLSMQERSALKQNPSKCAAA